MAYQYVPPVGLLDDVAIQYYSEIHDMIKPFVDYPHRDKKVISFGTECYAYDARLAPELDIFRTGIVSSVIDPKNVARDAMVRTCPEEGSNVIIIPPHGFALGHTVETFNIPNDVMAICIGKSTYARVGLIVNVTPINPGFRGQVVVELSNTTDYPLKVYANEGICQFFFLRGERTPTAVYNGYYNGQTGITLPPDLTQQ